MKAAGPGLADAVPINHGLVEIDAEARLLRPAQVELGELLGPADRGRRVPAQAGIDHQLDGRAEPLAGGADVGDVALFALAHRPPAELDGPEALVGELPGDLLRLGRR